jgi:hypothetical protein
MRHLNSSLPLLRRLGLGIGLCLGLGACNAPLDGGTGDPDLRAPAAADFRSEACEPPDLLVILDRTQTMHRTPDGATPPDTADGRKSSKLHQAITAIEGVMAAGLDRSVRFGLELFPRDPGGNLCVTLAERIQGRMATNPMCEAGQVVLPPALGTGQQITDALDPERTPLCNTTPTGRALQTAGDLLRQTRVAGRPQYIMLVTDGADFYDSCPDPDPLVVLRQLAAEGVKTFLIGFGAQTTMTGGVNPPLMNRLACAGQTAKDFATACKPADGGGGGYDAVNPDGARLYYDAASGGEVQTALRSVAAMVCCGCIG